MQNYLNTSTNYMEHLNMQTPDVTQLNLDALYKLCPSCFTEGKDAEGNLTHKVNWNKLRELLGDYAEENAPESYDFTWVGKRAAQREAAAPINKTLRPCPEESVDWENTQNLYIEGDNLEVLKLLQNSYMGKVKMIYIDPPYNTGNDFVYHDDCSLSEEEYKESIKDENGKRLIKNTYSNGSFHSDWCSMMYTRLLVTRSLLSEDGFIFISIDDNEDRNLRKLCDEVFGEQNFISQIAWKRKKEISNDSSNVAIQGEYIVVYSKSPQASLKLEPLSEDYIKSSYNKPTKDFPDGMWRPVPLTVSKGLKGGGYEYEIVNPNGTSHTRIWAYPKPSYEKLLSSGLVFFGKDGCGVPQRVMYLSSGQGQPISNYWDNVTTNKEGKKEILDHFGSNVFDTPKPSKLIQKIISVATDKNSIILDFFGGSSSTAEAILKTNNEDKSTRRFILVQLPEFTDKSSEAYKAGYKNICEIGKERIRRAGAKIKAENPNVDAGFRVFKCDSSNMKDVYFHPNDYSQDLLAGLEDNIKEDRTDLDLLFDCMLRWGVELSLPLSQKKVGDCTIHNVNDGDLVACFDGKITEAVIDEIAAMNPLRVVFRDSSFEEASEKMNLFELFKQKCQWSEQEVKNNVRVI